MVKGTQRQMIVVRTPESEIFEMAYLVLRTEVARGVSEGSMIDEANGIVSSFFTEGSDKKKAKRRKKIKRAGQLLLPALIGAVISVGVMVLVKLL